MTHGINFTKMHGAGNDYIMLDAIAHPELGGLARDPAFPAFVRWACDRRFGIGADGVFVIERCGELIQGEETDASAAVFNSDGTRGDMCGNGLRCAALLLRTHGHVPADALSIAAGSRRTTAEILPRAVDGAPARVRVAMGTVETDLASLPVDLSRVERREQVNSAGVLTVAGRRGVLIGVGNPHFVVPVDGDPAASGIFPGPGSPGFGPTIEHHPAFPRRVNVHAMERSAGDTLAVANFERGAGRTLACGTGACAAVRAAQLLGWVGPGARVLMEGGVLDVTIDSGGRASLTGPAEASFSGVAAFCPAAHAV